MKPINERDNCSYFLPAPPLPVQVVIPVAGATVPEFLAGHCRWSSSRPVPAIGEAVFTPMNGYGRGRVTSYFVEQGWLGLHVTLDLPIQRPPHRVGCKDAMLYGTDLADVPALPSRPDLVRVLAELYADATGPAMVYGNGVGNDGKKSGPTHQEFNALRAKRHADAKAALDLWAGIDGEPVYLHLTEQDGRELLHHALLMLPAGVTESQARADAQAARDAAREASPEEWNYDTVIRTLIDKGYTQVDWIEACE